MKINNIKLGADPELFLKNELELVSAEGLIGGTKEKPSSIPGMPGFYLQEDNVMVEFNIPPSDNQEKFQDSIEFGLEYIEEIARVRNLEISNLASGNLNPVFLQTPQALEFGCDPDINFYTKKENEVNVENNSTLRSCGGHIHIGYDKPNELTSAYLAFAMDVTLGLSSLLLDNDDRRRELYGKAGSFRIKKYGVEYRTLSNFWIFNRDKTEWAWEGTLSAIELVNSGIIKELETKFSKLIEITINNNKKHEVKNLIIEINNFIKTKKICAESLDMQETTQKN